MQHTPTLRAAFVIACFCSPVARAESVTTGKLAVVTNDAGRSPEAPPVAPRAALQNTRLPELELRDASLEDAAAFLSRASGVNIIVHPRAAQRRTKVTVSMRNVTLEEALRAITSAADAKYVVERRYIMITTRNDDSGDLTVKTYMVPQASMRGAEKSGAKAYLEQLGIPFPAGSSAVYKFGTGKLVVINTPANLGKLDKVIGALNGAAAE